MKKPSRYVIASAAVGVALTAFVADGLASSSQPRIAGQRPTRLRIVSSFVNTTFPNPATDYVEPSYADSEYLLRPAPGKPMPWLATSVSQVNATTWNIVLRRGVHFQDGHLLTAAVLVRWFEYNLANNPQAKILLDNPKSITATGGYSVRLRVSSSYNAVPFALANYNFPVYDSAVVKTVGGNYTKLAGRGIYTGPYAYQTSSGNKITYAANDHYWAGTPKYAGLSVTAITDDVAGEQALASGQADIEFVPSVQLKHLVAKNKNLIYKISSPAPAYSAFVLDPHKAPFTDERVRRAFALAIDNATISRTVLFGVRPSLNGTFPRNYPLNVAWKTFNVAQANALLNAAGWKRTGNGVRTKDGKSLTVEFTSYDTDLETIGTAAVQMLRKVGFDAKLLPEPSWPDVKPLLTGPGPVDATLENLQNFGYDGDPYLAVSRDYEINNGYNLVLHDTQIANLFNKTILVSRNTAAVNKAFKEVQTLNAKRVYYVPVVANPNTMLVTKAFKNLSVDPFYLFLNYKTVAAG